MRSPKLLDAGSPSINMTPMIDVVFLLIIFFLVSSHLAKQENAVELDLPKAVSGLDETVPRESLVINILPSGDWQIGSSKLGAEALAALFRRRAMASTEPIQLKIRTDREVPYERIEPLLKMAAQAGIGDIVFSVHEAARQ